MVRILNREFWIFGVCGLVVGGCNGGQASTDHVSYFAGLDIPGPELSVAEEDLRAAYKCKGDFSSLLQPVLFVPGTVTTPDEAFEWNYGNYFTSEGRPYCTVTLPDAARGDIQVNAEYVVYALRQTYAQAGRPIGVLGHSQGGMLPRWALRFWPDTRGMVEDQIGMAASHHGTVDTECSSSSPCNPAHWQQDPDSAFLEALNSRVETFTGIDYTSIYSFFDETVPAESSRLESGEGSISNVAIQDVCPRSSHGHLTVGTIDPVTHALVLDALNHAGPANLERIDRAVCEQLLMPGVTLDPRVLRILEILFRAMLESAPGNPTGAPLATAEPSLGCYVFAEGC